MLPQESVKHKKRSKIATLGIGMENKRDRRATARGVGTNTAECDFMKAKSG